MKPAPRGLYRRDGYTGPDLKEKWNINVSAIIYLMDCIVLGLQMTSTRQTAILYGILLIIVYTMVLDKVLMAGNTRMQVKIISLRYEINRLLGERLDRYLPAPYGNRLSPQ